MASEMPERALSATSLEVETDDDSLINVEKRRRKRFLWNPNVSVLSRRKWRAKRSKVTEDTNESSTTNVHSPHFSISTELDEQSYCSAVIETGSGIETGAEYAETEIASHCCTTMITSQLTSVITRTTAFLHRKLTATILAATTMTIR